MTATFTIDQPLGAGMGSPGEARRDIWLNQTVFLTALDLSPAGYEWEFEPGGLPPGSVAVIRADDQQQADFDPDLPGSYRVRLLWNGGGPGRVSTKVIRVTRDAAGALVKRGWGYPAFDERPDETNFGGNFRGYAPELEFILDDLLSVIGAGVGGELVIRRAFSFGDASPITLGSLLVGDWVTQASVVIDVPFDDPAATVEIGRPVEPSPGSYLKPGAVDVTTVGTYSDSKIVVNTAPTSLTCTITPGASTVGSGYLFIRIARS